MTCEGSIAPFQLLLNYLILSTVVVLIGASYQSLISVSIVKAAKAWIHLLVIPRATEVFGWTFTQTFFFLCQLHMTQIFTYTRLLIGILQYLMPFITISAFFPFHATSPACNVIPGFINIDWILSVVCTVIFYILLVPIMYTVTLVLVPGIPLAPLDLPYVGTIFQENKFAAREHYLPNWKGLGRASNYYNLVSSPDVWYP